MLESKKVYLQTNLGVQCNLTPKTTKIIKMEIIQLNQGGLILHVVIYVYVFTYLFIFETLFFIQEEV